MNNRNSLGMFLVERKLIDTSEWMECVAQQISCQMRIGELALRTGTLNMRQVQEILRVSAGTSVRFGEVAVELGFLTMMQIGVLLESQRMSRPSLETVLAESNTIDEDTLKLAVEAWRASPQ